MTRSSKRESWIPLAVVGAHLKGEPLNHELSELGGELMVSTKTAPRYRLFALDSVPPKPGLLRDVERGSEIELEVWSLPVARFGEFVARVSAPLCIGQLELAGGRWVHGFLCEAHAALEAEEITAFGGWRNFQRARPRGS